MLRYARERPTATTAFVCFACRLKITQNKYSSYKQAVICPECGGFCDNVGDRCPIPPRNKIAEWKKLQQDYRHIQRQIAEYYAFWQKRLRTEVAKHLQTARRLCLPDIIAEDETTLALLDKLPEIPPAAYMPFYYDWLKGCSEHVAQSCIACEPNCRYAQQIAALQARGTQDKNRRQQIEKLQYRKNTLYFDAPFGLWGFFPDHKYD